jgi:hypothetical protein
MSAAGKDRMTNRATKLLAEARNFIESGEEANWAAAERMWQANKEEGASKSEIGRRIGRSEATVRLWIRIWDSYPGTNRPSFTEAYAEMKGYSVSDLHNSTADKVARDRPERIVEAITKAPEPQRNEILSSLVSDQVMRGKIEDKVADHYKQSDSDSRTRYRLSDAAAAAGLGDYAVVLTNLADARHKLHAALERTREVNFEAIDVADILDRIDKCRLYLDALAEAAKGGNMDAELDRILAEGE